MHVTVHRRPAATVSSSSIAGALLLAIIAPSGRAVAQTWEARYDSVVPLASFNQLQCGAPTAFCPTGTVHGNNPHDAFASNAGTCAAADQLTCRFLRVAPPGGSGATVLRVRVDAGDMDPVWGATAPPRNELAYTIGERDYPDGNFTEGAERWFAWSTYVPANNEFADPPLDPVAGASGCRVQNAGTALFQLHAESGFSPAVGIGIVQTDWAGSACPHVYQAGTDWRFALTHSGTLYPPITDAPRVCASVSDCPSVDWDCQPSDETATATKYCVHSSRLWASDGAVRGIWNRFALHVKFSASRTSGLIELFFNGNKVFESAEATLEIADASTPAAVVRDYLKQGMYGCPSCTPSCNSTTCARSWDAIYHANLRVGATRWEADGDYAAAVIDAAAAVLF